jgi:hypothetical protein
MFGYAANNAMVGPPIEDMGFGPITLPPFMPPPHPMMPLQGMQPMVVHHHVRQPVNHIDPHFDMQPDRMISLGFKPEEMGMLDRVMCTDLNVSVQRMVDNGLGYETAKRLKYLYDICCGRVQIDSTEDLSKHFRKMYGQHRRIQMQDLSVSSVGEIPRKAVIAGIKDESFKIWNSGNYPVNERMYTVHDVSGSRIFIITDRRPVIRQGHGLKVEGVAEIIEDRPDKKLIVAIDKEYARLTNRFIIVASLRHPEYYLHMVEMVCFEGTRVYVYAQMSKPTTSVKYRENTQRVYNYGFYQSEIIPKLAEESKKIYDKLIGVAAIEHFGNTEYRVMPEEQEEYNEEAAVANAIVD